MTKAEKAEMEALRLRCALVWPPSPPKPFDLKGAMSAGNVDYLRLWWMNPYTLAVGRGVTNGYQHTTQDLTDDQIANRHRHDSRLSMTQGAGGPWFSSELDALRALHHAVARECAERLAVILLRVEAAS